jgi:hypothetical protein
MLDYAGHRGLNGDATELHSFAMSTMNVHDIYLEACAMQRAGISLSKIALRIDDLGDENGFVMVDKSGGDNVRLWRFEKTGEIIRFDGRDWHYLSNSEAAESHAESG